ncbi:uncharacterized protein LOC120326502 isoform X2 [Styela clava]
MTHYGINLKNSVHHKGVPMGSLYKDLLTHGKGLPPHRHHPSSYDFVFASTLRAHEYRILGKKGEGTFSEVLKCQHIKDGTYYACKKMKQHYNGVEEVNNLREIQAMRRLNPHANVIELHEIIFDKKTGTVALICELMDMNIYELIRGRRHYLQESKVKSYMYQLLKSLDHMHRCGIFHRDVKPENILVKDDLLKLADFGSCRSVYSKQPYTEYISTRWYRAPECLLTDGYYTYRMDLWSVGCVFFEVMSLHPLFPGANEVDQIAKIHDVLGTPDASILNKMKHRNRGINFDFPTKKGTGIEKLLPHASQQSIELIYKMCTYDPDERITAKQALRHSYFRDLRDADKRAHEAKQAARFSEVANKPAAAANTNDIPLWKQNQMQKKRSLSGRKSIDRHHLGFENHKLEKLPKQAVANAKKELKPARSDNFDLPLAEGLASDIRINNMKPNKSCKDIALPKKGKVSLLDFLQGPIGVKPIVAAKGSRPLWMPQKSTSFAESPSSKILKPAVIRDKGKGKKEKFTGAVCASGIVDKDVVCKPVIRNAEYTKKLKPLQQKGSEVLLQKRSIKSQLEKKVKDHLVGRRQRRLEQHHARGHQAIGGVGNHGGTGALPQIVPLNGTAIHGPSAFTTTSSKPPFPSTTLAKVPLHHSHQQGATLLPGILKPNMLGAKHLSKHKATDVTTKSMYGHYQLPSINRHVYH